MNWKVIWKPDAERRLTSIWLADRSRQRVTDAAREIDATLESDPLNAGESRSGNDRIIFSEPLAVLVELLPLEHEVHVLAVWRY